MSDALTEILNFKPNLWQKTYWPVKRFIKDIPWKIKQVKFFYQRGKRGYADCDLWSLDYYITKIMIQALKQFKNNHGGYPGHGEAETPEKWDSIIEEMIVGFEAAQRVIDDDYFKTTGFPEQHKEGDAKKWIKLSKEDQKIFKDKMKIFIKWYFHLWD